MIRSSGLFSIPHGVVFIFDPTMLVEIPQDTSIGPILSTNDCLSVWTAQEGEGIVEISIANHLIDKELIHLFSGKLPSESGRISIHSSGLDELVSMETRKGEISVDIFSNDSAYPTKLVCVLT